MRGIVWSYCNEDAIKQLLKIEKEYNDFHIKTHKRVIKSFSNSSYIIFDNNDIWTVVRASDCERGHYANISYIDRRINQDIINSIIKPATKAWPYRAFNFYTPENFSWTEGDKEIEPTFI